MIGIKVNEEWIDIDTSITMTLINPIFDKEKFQRTFSYPINLKNTPRNKKILAYADRLDGPTSKTVPGAKLYINHLLFETGVIRIKGASDTQIRIVFESSALDYMKTVETKSIRSLSMPVTVPFNFCFSAQFQVTDIQNNGKRLKLGINGHVFARLYPERNLLVNDINDVFPGIATLVSSDATSMVIDITCSDPTLPLYIDVSPVYLFAEPAVPQASFNVIGNPTRTSEKMQEAWQAWISSTNSSPENHVFPAVKNSSLYEGLNTAFSGYINYVNSSNELQVNQVKDVVNKLNFPYALSPFPFVASIIQKIAEQAGVNVYGDFLGDTELSSLILLSNVSIDQIIEERYEEVFQGQQAYINLWKRSYDLADQMPDISIKDFLVALAETFNLSITLTDGDLRIDFIRNLLKKPAQNWTQKAEPSYDQTFGDTESFNFDYDRQGNDDELVANQLQPIENQLGSATIQAPFFSAYNLQEFDGISGRTWSIPFLDEPGNSDEFPELDNEVSRRLLFYRGIAKDVDGNDYAYATFQAEDAGGNDIGDYSLEWAGEKGLYETWWKELIEILKSPRKVTLPIRLSMSDLIDLRAWKNPIVRIEHPKGIVEGVIKDVKFKASPIGISVAQVTIIAK
jgi:hypothetical protein